MNHDQNSPNPSPNPSADLRITTPLPEQLPALQEIERAAGCWFAEIGMTAVAEDEPADIETLDLYRISGMAWVGTLDGRPDPVAYLLADPVDGNLHIEQVTVHPDWARRGFGRRLIEHLVTVGRTMGVPALTLTTFTEVPWNAPYYARCGFRIMEPDELGAELLAVSEHEALRGMHRWPRVCMRREIQPEPARATRSHPEPA